jgi:hypothetical protein
MLAWVGKGFREEDLRALGRRRAPQEHGVVLQQQVPPVAPPPRVRGAPKRFVCIFFVFVVSHMPHCTRRRKLDIVTGTNVRKHWKTEDKAFEGRVVGVRDDKGVRVIEVAYVDRDRVAHREDDDSWDEDDWVVLSNEPQHDGSIWNKATTDQIRFVKRHMEIHLHSKLKLFLQQKRQHRTTLSSVMIEEWTGEDHLLFFGTTDEIVIHTNDDMTRLFAPVCGNLPIKRVGRSKDSDMRLCVCAPGMIRRGSGSTVVFFAYNQYHRIREGVWEEMWLAEVAGTPQHGRKKAKQLE